MPLDATIHDIILSRYLIFVAIRRRRRFATFTPPMPRCCYAVLAMRAALFSAMRARGVAKAVTTRGVAAPQSVRRYVAYACTKMRVY